MEGSESRSRQDQFKLPLECKSYRYNEDEESKKSSQMYVSNDARARRIKEIV